MARKKVEKALGIKDIVTLATSGWTPGEVNALLDRLDSIGDVNAPEEVDYETDDKEDKDIDTDDPGEDEPDEDEEDNDTDDDDKEDSTNKKKDNDKSNLLENENKRLKKQLEKLQMKNRSKDVSGGKDEKPMEQSLIDTFQSLFD